MMLAVKLKKKKFGRKKKLGGERMNFFPGEKLIEEMKKIEERRKQLHLPYAFTKSYIARGGIRRMLEHLTSLLDKAETGDLHAKRRVNKLGQKTKKRNETEKQT